MKKFVALTFAASTLILAGCCTVHQGHAATKWEYQIVYNLSDVNKLAEQGWSLAAFSLNPNNQTVFIVKHQIQ